MLIELQIENLGVIERVDLVLGEGLTALTGETGAGKTMLVEAIELLVGGRADAGIVRHGAGEARVDGRFVVDDGAGGEREVVLTRIVPAEGRSRAYVDGRASTATALAELASQLVDLHGQHAHQSLLAGSAQRAALDRYGRIDLGPLRTARTRIAELDAALADLGGDERARAREIDLLRFQVGELDAAGIDDPDEDERLAAEESVLADAVAHREAAAAALEVLVADDAARDLLAQALARLDDRSPFAPIATRLTDLLAELEDVTAELRDSGESIEEDPERLAQLRERRHVLRELRRKYGADLAEVMAHHRRTAERLHDLERYEQRAAELEVERVEAMRVERAAAQEVGDRRRTVAPELADLVQARLGELAMAGAVVEIQVGEAPDDHSGDRVRFLLAANPGTPPMSLNRVASGGELARTMLALRLALTVDAPSATPDDRAVPTLVFDEVDAGIGGGAAVAVGDALAALSRHHQVLVVTHLPQVAARADHQVVVTKRVAGGTTQAEIRPVTGEDRVAELARMLAGEDGEVARRHARELLALPPPRHR